LGGEWEFVLWFTAGEPVLDAFDEESGHGSWGRVSREVLLEVIEGFEMCCLSVFAGAAVDMFSVFTEVTACKAAPVDLVVSGGEVVVVGVPFVGELGNLDLVAYGHGLHGGFDALPVNVIEGVVVPLVGDGTVTVGGFLK